MGSIRIVVAIFSYDGGLYFGVTGDYDNAPDIDVLTAGIERGMDDLLALVAPPKSARRNGAKAARERSQGRPSQRRQGGRGAHEGEQASIEVESPAAAPQRAAIGGTGHSEGGRRMKLLQVNYRRERGQDDVEQADRLVGAAERISGLPGLQWKLWIHDDSQNAAGGIYLFDTEEHARAWGDEALPASLGRLPGVSAIEARYFDVDERLSAITRGPLVAASEV